MTMLPPCVNVQALGDLPAEPILRQHPLNRFFDHPFRLPGQCPFERDLFEVPYVTGVTVVDLPPPLLSGDADLFGIDHNHRIPHLGTRSIGRLVLPPQKGSDPRRKPPEDHPLGIDQMPTLVHLIRTVETSHFLHYETMKFILPPSSCQPNPSLLYRPIGGPLFKPPLGRSPQQGAFPGRRPRRGRDRGEERSGPIAGNLSPPKPP